MKFILFAILSCWFLTTYIGAYEILLAINCGGDTHVDSMGIEYHPSDDTECNPSSSLNPWLPNVPKADQILYRTFCYRGRDATFHLPIKGNGKYLLVIKLNPKLKYLLVTLNQKHKIFTIDDIDNVEDGDAGYDHYTFFTVCDSKLLYEDETSRIGSGNEIEMNTALYTAISAFVLVKGDVENFPVLPTAKNFQKEDLDKIYEHECPSDLMRAEQLMSSPVANRTEVTLVSSTTESLPGNGTGGVTNIYNYYNMTMIFLVVTNKNKNDTAEP